MIQRFAIRSGTNSWVLGSREQGAGNRQEARGKRQEARGKKSCVPHSYEKRYIKKHIAVARAGADMTKVSNLSKRKSLTSDF
ncbi:hypothetical protein BJP34_35155 [Moorena producens PAL-8-15-08-1]|uniref:Uncharacterized protein n=1 Tax=Moorena producens PAL-8-15-08-1 TaxID=1458985 RepID=A0A1D8U2H0_9CYAN|nr:hypothetical protein BJP34_35155 [Moorena producens PAL-8-15-08-1]